MHNALHIASAFRLVVITWAMVMVMVIQMVMVMVGS
jgi:hypothetical protein